MQELNLKKRKLKSISNTWVPWICLCKKVKRAACPCYLAWKRCLTFQLSTTEIKCSRIDSNFNGHHSIPESSSFTSFSSGLSIVQTKDTLELKKDTFLSKPPSGVVALTSTCSSVFHAHESLAVASLHSSIETVIHRDPKNDITMPAMDQDKSGNQSRSKIGSRSVKSSDSPTHSSHSYSNKDFDIKNNHSNNKHNSFSRSLSHSRTSKTLSPCPYSMRNSDCRFNLLEQKIGNNPLTTEVKVRVGFEQIDILPPKGEVGVEVVVQGLIFDRMNSSLAEKDKDFEFKVVVHGMMFDPMKPFSDKDNKVAVAVTVPFQEKDSMFFLFVNANGIDQDIVVHFFNENNNNHLEVVRNK